MLAPALPKEAVWTTVARSVFWSRDVVLDTWRAQVLAGHPAYLPDSVSRMSTWHFVRFLGRSLFEKHWPLLRQSLAATHPGRSRLDVAWSLATSGGFNQPPEAALTEFPGRCREIFDVIVQQQGLSIYEAARRCGMPYRRAHAHVNWLTGKNLLRSRIDTNGARRQRRLYTMA